MNTNFMEEELFCHFIKKFDLSQIGITPKTRSIEDLERDYNNWLKESRVALLDLDSICYSIFHPNKVLDEQGNPKRTEDGKKFIYQDKTPQEVLDSADYLMNEILTSCNCTHYVAIIKGKNTINYKLAINPDYKQDRNTEQPKYWEFTKEYLKLKWGATAIDLIETDDLIRITNLKLPNSFIVAIDSDLLGLSGTHFNWRTKEWVTTTKEEEHLNFWTQMITGNHNNIQGIPSRGEKYAQKIFDQEILTSDYDHSIIVFKEYIAKFGVDKGIKEFYKNYISIKTLDSMDIFKMPKINKFKKKEEEQVSDIKF